MKFYELSGTEATEIHSLHRRRMKPVDIGAIALVIFFSGLLLYEVARHYLKF